jgi:hypothetical protein
MRRSFLMDVIKELFLKRCSPSIGAGSLDQLVPANENSEILAL